MKGFRKYTSSRNVFHRFVGKIVTKGLQRLVRASQPKGLVDEAFEQNSCNRFVTCENPRLNRHLLLRHRRNLSFVLCVCVKPPKPNEFARIHINHNPNVECLTTIQWFSPLRLLRIHRLWIKTEGLNKVHSSICSSNQLRPKRLEAFSVPKSI